VLDDFDVRDDDPIDVKDKPENVEKLRRRIEKYEGVPPLNPPRDGKKLLVLDIDYTLFDHRSTAEHPLELMRPYLHEFLTRAYEHYDIAIWSATGVSWIELKMKELGVLTTVMGHSAVAASALEAAPTANVRAPANAAFALSPSAFGKRWLSSRETLSRSRK
jgi:hypothetical protein